MIAIPCQAGLQRRRGCIEPEPATCPCGRSTIEQEPTRMSRTVGGPRPAGIYEGAMLFITLFLVTIGILRTKEIREGQ